MKKEKESRVSGTVDTSESRENDLRWAFGLNRFSLRLMGIWPERQYVEEGFLKTALRIPSMIFSMACFIFVPQMYAFILVKGDLLLIIDNLMTSCPAFTGCLKLFFLWRNRRIGILRISLNDQVNQVDVRKSEEFDVVHTRVVVHSVTEDWLRPKSKWERYKMLKEAYVAKLFTIGGYVFISGAYLGFIIAPLFGLNIRVVSNFTDYGNRHLLVQSYYPYDYSKTPNFELTHFSQLLAGTFIAMSLAIPDNYFGALIFHLSTQFQILGIAIEQFIKEDILATRVKSKLFNDHLGFYIRRHVHLIQMVTAVEKSFSLLILTQLFCMCVMACCLGFRILYTLQNASEKVSIVQILNLAAALLSLMLFTLADCSASETLALHSSEMFYHIYNCKWYSVPKQNTQDLIMMMMMSRNPQSCTAGKIMRLSLSTYCSILKSIGGYLSVLIASSN